jgi:hypothetical protein
MIYHLVKYGGFRFMTSGIRGLKTEAPAAVFEAPAVVARLDDIAVVVTRSSSAVVILGSPKTVTNIRCAVYTRLIMERSLGFAAGPFNMPGYCLSSSCRCKSEAWYPEGKDVR